MYCDEAEFVRAAVKAGHPRSLRASLPCHISRCVHLLSKAPANEVVSARAAWFGKWTARANAIAADPCPHWSVEGDRRKIMSCKRLQLLDEIIRTEGYGDVLLPRDMLKGFDLTGRVPTSGVLPGKISPAAMHADDLMMHSGRNREEFASRWDLPAILSKTGHCGPRLLRRWKRAGSSGHSSGTIFVKGTSCHIVSP